VSNEIEFWMNQIDLLLGCKNELKSLTRPLKKERVPETIRIATRDAKTLEEANNIAKSCSPRSIISSDNPPIFMSYRMSPCDKLPGALKRVRGRLIHHFNLEIALKVKWTPSTLKSTCNPPVQNLNTNIRLSSSLISC
jgi:hypothetical protein